MSKSSLWMPIYTADYLADTMSLNTQQHGAYLLLMMEMWRHGPLANVPERLAAVARVNKGTWLKRIWPALQDFIDIDENGCLFQKRLIEEREKSNGLINKGKELAKARWEKKGDKATKEKTTEERSASDNSDGAERRICENTPAAYANHNHNKKTAKAVDNPPISPRPEKSSRRTDKQQKTILPDWIPQDEWNGWVEMRKRKKCPSTAHAIALSINKLADFHADGEDLSEVLNQSTQRGWTGLFSVKNRGGNSGKQTGEPPPFNGFEGFADGFDIDLSAPPPQKKEERDMRSAL